eukprot:3641683-Amphidinium_carterae.1
MQQQPAGQQPQLGFLTKQLFSTNHRAKPERPNPKAPRLQLPCQPAGYDGNYDLEHHNFYEGLRTLRANQFPTHDMKPTKSTVATAKRSKVTKTTANQ